MNPRNILATLVANKDRIASGAVFLGTVLIAAGLIPDVFPAKGEVEYYDVDTDSDDTTDEA